MPLADFWGQMDQPSQLAVSLGVPLAIAGLINSFMGGDGMMSMLMTLLGGGAALAGGTGILSQLMGGAAGAAQGTVPADASAPGAPPVAPAAGDANTAYLKSLPKDQQQNLLSYATQTDPALRESQYAMARPHLDKLYGGNTNNFSHAMIQGAMKPHLDRMRQQESNVFSQLMAGK